MNLPPLACLAPLLFAPPAFSGPELEPRARLMTSFIVVSDDSDTSSRFDLDALELGLIADWNKTFRLEAQLDATRSSSPESLFGIDGNSVVFAARRALGALTLPIGPGDLTLSLGILPDPVISTLEILDF